MPTHQLLVMRHADAVPWVSGGPDLDRELTLTGSARATSRNAVLAAHPPDLVWCSAAVRAQQTLGRLDTGTAAVEVLPDLYGASATDLLELLAAVPEGIGTLLVIGHMPTVAQVVVGLDPTLATAAGRAPGASTFRAAGGFSPAGIAVLQVDVAWDALAPGSATLERYVG